jgi:polyhydroxyalkanoate synthesis regulator phasin
MELELREFTRNSRCDINRCKERASISIGNVGGPASTRFNVCKDDLRQIVLKGAELLDMQIGEDKAMIDDFTKQMESKDETINQFHAQIDDLNKALGETEALQALYSASEARVKELEAQLSAPQAEATPEATAKKGGK